MPSLSHVPAVRAWRRSLLLLPLVVALAACGKSEAPAAPGAGKPGGGMPPPEVGVIAVQPGDVGLQTELPGRLEASRVAQVRARVAGILQQRLFREGSDVKAGQALFRIDAAPYQATLQSAQATLARAQAPSTWTAAACAKAVALAASAARSAVVRSSFFMGVPFTVGCWSNRPPALMW